MSRNRFPDLAAETEAFVASVEKRIAAGQAVRRAVPGGWLHMDRPLPFLCVYRHPTEGAVEGAERLVLSQASHLSISNEPGLAPALGRLIAALGRALSGQFGAFLVIEVWPVPGGDTFRIHAPPTEPASTLAALAEALKHIDVLGGARPGRGCRRSGPGAAGDAAVAHPQGAAVGGRSAVRAGGSRVLPRSGRPPLPRSAAPPPARPGPSAAEGRLRVHHGPDELRARRTSGPSGPAGCSRPPARPTVAWPRSPSQIDYLLAITPVNADAAWAEFRDGGFRHDPTFHYRPLTVDPDLLKRALYAVPLERVEDPTLEGMFRAQRQALDRQVSLLEDRGSDAFLPTSLQLFGTVDDDLLGLAETLLARIRERWATGGGCETAAGAVPRRRRVRRAGPRRARPLPGRRTGRGGDGVGPRRRPRGAGVARANCWSAPGVQIPRARVDALVQHEVGTHIVTAVNGQAQPLRLLSTGLAGYEETQEGLAVLAEYVVGGLTVERLVTLAARVVAVGRLVAGATFTETFHDLHDVHGLTAGQAFQVAMRVHRSGGLTKDAIYLRGLDRLLRHLADGHPLDPLLVGKVPLAYVPVVGRAAVARRAEPAPVAAPVVDRARLPGAPRRRPGRPQHRGPRSGARRVKLGIFVNDVACEKPEYTTTGLALAAVGRGHEVWYIGAGDFACDADDAVRARACRAPSRTGRAGGFPGGHGPRADHGRRPRRPVAAQQSGRRRPRPASGPRRRASSSVGWPPAAASSW